MKFVRKTPYGQRGGKADKFESSGDESNYEVGGGANSDEDGFPAVCPICDDEFRDPVMSKCICLDIL